MSNTTDLSPEDRRAIADYCAWAATAEGRETLVRQAREAREAARRMRERAIVPEEVMRKRYTPIPYPT